MKLPAQMTSPGLKKVFAALGGDATTRFVGGCVRNALIGEPIGDIDIATVLTPDAVIERLRGAGIKVIPTGIDHGTITAVIDGQGYEITTLRRDVATDGRRAVVAYTEDWAEDAQRRDFTMNTLLADMTGHVFDPLGHGRRDLERRKVLFVGDPAQRIREDYLRVLRFFRFHARYGRGAPDKAALLACAAASRNLKMLSKERVTQEVLKLLAVAKCPAVLTIMQSHKILPEVIAPAYEETLLKSLIKKQKDVDMTARLLVLCGNRIAGLKKIGHALRLTNKTVLQMGAILAAQKTLQKFEPHFVLLSLYKHGRAATLQALYIMNAPARLVRLAEAGDIPVFPYNGKALLKAGYKSGPEIGKILQKLERQWIASGFKASALPVVKTSK